MKRRYKSLIGIASLLIVASSMYVYSVMSYSGQLEDAIYIDGQSSQYKTLSQIVSAEKYKNRLVYIDIWGTRCGPCLNEFPDSKQLVDHYFTDKRVSFLYLCSPYGKLDDEFRWKRYVQKYGLKGHHILLTEEAYFGIYKEIESNPDQRNYIPRHLLVKNGKLVVANAPSPSSKAEVIALIDSLRN